MEELKEAREKQVAKKPIHDDGVWSICPCCGARVANDSEEAVNGEVSYCEKCGTKFDWKEGWDND